MNESNSSVFTALDDDGLDIEAIFGTSNAGSENPFEAPEPAQEIMEEKQEAPAEQKSEETPPPAPEKKTEKAKPEKKDIPDPISAAFENKTQENTQKGLYVETGKLTVALSDVDEAKADEIIHLPRVHTRLLAMLVVSFFRSLRARFFGKPAEKEMSETRSFRSEKRLDTFRTSSIPNTYGARRTRAWTIITMPALRHKGEKMLTERECDRIRAVNRRNEYCLTPTLMQSLFHRHETARKKGDRHTMEAIEYQLTDINFHYECGLLSQGRYDKLDEVLRNW